MCSAAESTQSLRFQHEILYFLSFPHYSYIWKKSSQTSPLDFIMLLTCSAWTNRHNYYWQNRWFLEVARLCLAAKKYIEYDFLIFQISISSQARCNQLKQKLIFVMSEVIRFYDMHTENRTLWVKSAEFFMILTSFALLFFFFIEHSRGGILKSAKDYVFLQHTRSSRIIQFFGKVKTISIEY